jgi:peptidoglycan/xylan/chitin deacetylase (PgdA/CDA1 family)
VVALVVFVLLAGAAVLMAATSSGGGGRHAATAPAAAAVRPPAASSARWPRPRTAVVLFGARRRREALAVDATLSYTQFVARGGSRHRLIALTFDDGPGPYTRQIVRILLRMRVPATFFIVGQQLVDFSAAARDELEHGFDLGDHTMNHAWLTRLNPAGQYSQVAADAAALERLGAPAPRLFRPPYGVYNATTLSALRRLRMLMVLWSVDPRDWRMPGVKAIVSSVMSAARAGAIVILHDGGGNRSQTVAALPAIIRGLRKRGFELVTVPRLIKLDPPSRHQQLPRLGAA